MWNKKDDISDLVLIFLLSIVSLDATLNRCCTLLTSKDIINTHRCGQYVLDNSEIFTITVRHLDCEITIYKHLILYMCSIKLQTL